MGSRTSIEFTKPNTIWLTFRFWNQLYTFVSETGPWFCSSAVICLMRSLLGVPILEQNSVSKLWKCSSQSHGAIPAVPTDALKMIEFACQGKSWYDSSTRPGCWTYPPNTCSILLSLQLHILVQAVVTTTSMCTRKLDVIHHPTG